MRKSSHHLFALKHVVGSCQICTRGVQLSSQPVNLQPLLGIDGKLRTKDETTHESRYSLWRQNAQLELCEGPREVQHGPDFR